MKKTKRIMVLLLAFLCIFMAGCGKNKDTDSDDTGEQITTALSTEQSIINITKHFDDYYATYITMLNDNLHNSDVIENITHAHPHTISHSIKNSADPLEIISSEIQPWQVYENMNMMNLVNGIFEYYVTYANIENGYGETFEKGKYYKTQFLQGPYDFIYNAFYDQVDNNIIARFNSIDKIAGDPESDIGWSAFYFMISCDPKTNEPLSISYYHALLNTSQSGIFDNEVILNKATLDLTSNKFTQWNAYISSSYLQFSDNLDDWNFIKNNLRTFEYTTADFNNDLLTDDDYIYFQAYIYDNTEFFTDDDYKFYSDIVKNELLDAYFVDFETMTGDYQTAVIFDNDDLMDGYNYTEIKYTPERIQDDEGNTLGYQHRLNGIQKEIDNIDFILENELLTELLNDFELNISGRDFDVPAADGISKLEKTINDMSAWFNLCDKTKIYIKTVIFENYKFRMDHSGLEFIFEDGSEISYLRVRLNKTSSYYSLTITEAAYNRVTETLSSFQLYLSSESGFEYTLAKCEIDWDTLSNNYGEWDEEYYQNDDPHKITDYLSQLEYVRVWKHSETSSLNLDSLTYHFFDNEKESFIYKEGIHLYNMFKDKTTKDFEEYSPRHAINTNLIKVLVENKFSEGFRK